MLSQLSIFLFLGQAVAMPALERLPWEARDLAPANASIIRLSPRQDAFEDKSFDPSDLSWINKLAAIGDSYSAGIGAGDRLGNIFQALDPASDYACSRYDHSYPYIINNDDRLGDPGKRNFQFKSCSGAVTKDVLEKQIPSIDGGQQVILLSIGGNDAQLSNILNQCIFQWAVLNKEQEIIGKIASLADERFEWAADFDWEALARGCDGQLDHTKEIIDSEAFSASIDAVINAAKGKLAEGGMIYQTGYGKFFGEDLSPECDNVSWSTWIYKLANMFQPEAKLTTDHRRRMNELVDAVNAKLQAAAERAGGSVKFINYDSYIGEFHGRFCEPGVDESTKESNTRPRLMFYELDTLDPLGQSPWKRSPSGPLNGTFEGSLEIFAQITLLADADAKLIHQDKIKDEEPAAAPAAGVSKAAADVSVAAIDIQVPNLLPDGYGRVFHPQALLHEIIANRVLFDIVSDNEKRNGHPAIPEMLSINSCPLGNPAPSPITDIKCTPPSKQIFDIDPENAAKIAQKFCEDSGVDFTKDASVRTLDGSALNPPVELKSNMIFTFSHEDGKCAKSCTDIYKDMIQRCKFNSHTLAGSAEVSQPCGTYKLEMAPAPEQKPEWHANCADNTVFTPFKRDVALRNIEDFCKHNFSLPAAAQPVWKTYKEDGVNLQLVVSWSQGGQDGCHRSGNSQGGEIGFPDCRDRFQSAMDDCNTDTQDKKYGSKPLVWNSPNGCIDFQLYGDGADWDCEGLGVAPLQCLNQGIHLD